MVAGFTLLTQESGTQNTEHNAYKVGDSVFINGLNALKILHSALEMYACVNYAKGEAYIECLDEIGIYRLDDLKPNEWIFIGYNDLEKAIRKSIFLKYKDGTRKRGSYFQMCLSELGLLDV